MIQIQLENYLSCSKSPSNKHIFLNNTVFLNTPKTGGKTLRPQFWSCTV